jgi:hypothetical protein
MRRPHYGFRWLVNPFSQDYGKSRDEGYDVDGLYVQQPRHTDDYP